MQSCICAATDHTDTVRQLDEMLQHVWDGGKLNPPLPPPPPAPVPLGPRYQFALVVAGRRSADAVLCLGSVLGSDIVALQPCPTEARVATEWVEVHARQHLQTLTQLESVASGLCMNIYGGVNLGCKSGKRIHGNRCVGFPLGNRLAWDSNISSIRVSAAKSGCDDMCVGATSAGGGAIVLKQCGDNFTKWERTKLV